MAVSMISMNSLSYSNYDSGSPAGNSGLLDFSVPSSGSDPSSMDAGASSADPSAQMAPSPDATMMGMTPSDSFQSSAPAADFTPPPQAAPDASGGFDFVA